MNVSQQIEALLFYARKKIGLAEEDVCYTRNLLFDALGVSEQYEGGIDCAAIDALTVPDTLIAPIGAYAVEKGLCEEGQRANFEAKIMGLLTPPPSAVTAAFRAAVARDGIAKACDWFYAMCIANNYIQKTAVDRSLRYRHDFRDNYLEITINLSKPEKSNKETAKLLTRTSTSYPKCMLCPENVGFAGNASKPSRFNLRAIPLTLDGEPWLMQYSPYVYYHEHCIVLNTRHTPMRMVPGVLRKLADFVDAFPNFFLGSNACLPIVGGSILDHEHFQGGGHLMPMQLAPARRVLSRPGAAVKVSEVEWYNNVLRLESADREALIALGGKCIESWETFSRPEIGLLARTTAQHNALSPIMRKVDGGYILDIILRNNRTDETYPDGIYHAHPEYHNIKSEAIGLIEAMGLFILPGRLKRQMAEVESVLLGGSTEGWAETDMKIHLGFAARLMSEHGVVATKEEADKIICDAIADVCANILDNTAVFKHDVAGRAAFDAFVATLGI